VNWYETSRWYWPVTLAILAIGITAMQMALS
jgi:hypothetical protein